MTLMLTTLGRRLRYSEDGVYRVEGLVQKMARCMAPTLTSHSLWKGREETQGGSSAQ